MLCALCERVCWRARRRGVQARTITLKLRYADFDTLTLEGEQAERWLATTHCDV
jgi:nucleotidyltransferase/DNA polymerase involved in DNA repair